MKRYTIVIMHKKAHFKLYKSPKNKRFTQKNHIKY